MVYATAAAKRWQRRQNLPLPFFCRIEESTLCWFDFCGSKRILPIEAIKNDFSN